MINLAVILSINNSYSVI